jgi:hypothetical protein
MSRRKVYIAPSMGDVGKAINDVFDRHSDIDPSLADPEIRQGFIMFVWTVGQILAKQLTEREETTPAVDTEEK